MRQLIAALILMTVANFAMAAYNGQCIRTLANYAWQCDIDSSMNRQMLIYINKDVETFDGMAYQPLRGHPLR